MITITVNGKNEETEKINLLEYLLSKNIDKDKIVVELNGRIIKKEELENTIIKENDKIEIIRFIGGGWLRWIR